MHVKQNQHNNFHLNICKHMLMSHKLCCDYDAVAIKKKMMESAKAKIAHGVGVGVGDSDHGDVVGTMQLWLHWSKKKCSINVNQV